MSIFSNEDYKREHQQTNKIKNFSRSKYHGGIATSKKVRFPTQHRSPNHKCSLCERKDAKKYYISEKEVRWLCPICVIKNKNKDSKEKVDFIRARQLGIKN